MVVDIQTRMLQKGRGKVWIWARLYAQLRTEEGVAEAAKFARENIPQQFSHQVSELVKEAMIDEYEI